MLDYSSTPDVFQCRLWYAVIEFTNSPLLIRGDKSMINSFNLVRFIYTSVSLLLLRRPAINISTFNDKATVEPSHRKPSTV